MSFRTNARQMTTSSGKCFQPFVGLSIVQLFVILVLLFRQEKINSNRIKREVNRVSPLSMNCSRVFESNRSLFVRGRRFILDLLRRWWHNNSSCPLEPNNLIGPLPVNKLLVSPSLLDALQDVEVGGTWSPRHCRPREKLVVVVPYRDRPKNLRTLLLFMHYFLQRQLLDYRIVVVEQAGNATFNRGMLMNIGFKEALDIQQVDCVIFHDVDLLPENDRNFYRCGSMPRHMSVAVNTLNYTLPYRNLFGGVEAFKSVQFLAINGFSNMYFGWGGEDDDLFNRVHFNQMEVTRYPIEVARYRMLQHKKEPPSPSRLKLLKHGMLRLESDGLSSLGYKCLTMEETPLYTRISVDLDSFFRANSSLSNDKIGEKMYGVDKNESSNLNNNNIHTRTRQH